MAQLKSTKKYDINPICSHCEQELEEVYYTVIKRFPANWLYFYPHCSKTLGSSGW